MGKKWNFEGSYKIFRDRHLTLPPYPVLCAEILVPPWSTMYCCMWKTKKCKRKGKRTNNSHETRAIEVYHDRRHTKDASDDSKRWLVDTKEEDERIRAKRENMYEQVDEKRVTNIPHLQTTYVGWKSRASPDKWLWIIRHHSNNRHPNLWHLEFRRSGKQISSQNKIYGMSNGCAMYLCHSDS